MVQNFKETKHHVFTSINALSRGILRQSKGKHPYTSTLNRRIQNCCSRLYSLRVSSVSTEQFRVGVINTNRETANNPDFRWIRRKYKSTMLMDSVQAGEVQSLVCTPRQISATGNGLSGNLKTFGDMRMHSQISMLCDLMSWKKIKTYDYFITKPSLQDGHGGVDTQCKEYTFSRSDHRSRIHCRIPEGTKIVPVIDIKVVQSIGVHGIEIAVPSMRDHSRTSWILITRGKIDSSTKWKIPVSVLMFPVPTCSNNKPNQKKQLLPKRTVRAPGNRAATKTRRAQAE